MSPDKHDWLKRSTTFSRLVNPELHAKPNLTVGAIGTGVFVFVLGNLLYQRHVYIQKQTFFGFLARSSAQEKQGVCEKSEIPVVRNLSELGQDSYGRPGLSHMTIAGAVHHGMKEVEVWMQTFAPNSGTPIHRHDCEEVFITLKGHGTLYLSRSPDPDVPGRPEELQIYPNATFTIPVNSVHQVRNTKQAGDLQLIVTISRPPMQSYVYNDWITPHRSAMSEIKEWDKQNKFSSASQQCMEREPEDAVMASIAKLLGISIEDVVVSDEIR